ncbi:hypothetical protein CJF30_00011116 [Rutstroemia sp. NJR-2017a BBW]|nr:hypothetical protein CJF30_00011116 [Rutstroemia sp. NJR-2017a BBW]
MGGAASGGIFGAGISGAGVFAAAATAAAAGGALDGEDFDSFELKERFLAAWNRDTRGEEQEKLEELLEKVCQYDGFEGFLLPPSKEEMLVIA